MNVQETDEICELTTVELDDVSGGVPWALIVPIVLAEGAVAGMWAAIIYTESLGGTLNGCRCGR